MPSTRSKEDTWTTDELNRALKRDDRKSNRDRDDDKRRRGDVNGDDKNRRRRDDDERRRYQDKDDDKRRHPRDDDRRSSKNKDEEKKDDVNLTEEEREKLRRERREKREKTGKSDGKEIAFRGRGNDERLKGTKEDEQSKSRHRDEDDRKRRHQKHADDDDKEERRRHRDEDIDSSSRRKQRDEDDDEKRRRHRDEEDQDKRRRHRDEEEKDRERRKHRDDDEEERERQRRERRERRERGGERSHSKKDRDEDEERRRRHEGNKERRKDDDRRKEDDKDKRKDGDDRKHRRDKNEDEHSRRPDDKRRSQDSRKEKTEEKENVDDDDYNYEDDFENYEEDFEEDDEDEDPKPMALQNIIPGQILDYSTAKKIIDSEVDEILRALDEENNRLLNESHKGQPSESKEKSSNRYHDNSDKEEDNYKYHSNETAPAVSRARTVINFVSAKQRAMSRKTANKTIQRGRDLLQMLELDVARFDLLDLPPVKEYDLYIRSFGRTDTKQAYVQTNDDNIDRDIQTEEIDSRQKWTQHPPEDFLGVGRGDGEKDFEEEEQSQMKQNKEQDLGRLHKFLANAGQVMGILLDEKRDEETRGESGSNKSSISISEGYSQLVVLDILAGRYVEFACFSPTQPNFLLTLYSKPQTVADDKPVDKRGIICVWNTNEPFYPHKILACESQPKCCCFSPVKPTLVFAGMVDGSIAVWDLREIASLHKSVVVNSHEYLLRFPTYDTAGVLDNENHHSPVNSICPIYSYMTMSNKSDQQFSDPSDDSSAGLSFQLVSTEDMAVLHFWVVAEIMHPDPSGSESDLGLAPGGQVKLLKSSSLTLDGPARDGFLKTTMRALSMQLLPSDPNQFYIATDLGFVFHGLRFSSRAYPSTHFAEIQTPLDVTCIDFSPFEKPCFLAGYKDGSFSLYHTKSEKPIMTWSSVTQGRPILSVMWSRSRPCLFFVFDDSSNMYIFDLLEGDTVPKHIERVSKERVVSVACSTDHKATGLGIPGRLPQMFISLESGKTEIHTFAKSVRESEPLEAEFFTKYLDKF
ncbi:hypothetical protein CHS0354_005310 [Potamilus streckersoni]|uniref:WD repeat-containing protein 60 n=1 Tax=Potamilus streckersoni TaxID=2493646 RepID=A0AAE0VWA0_9BIVA|nr:hypothetical protein CHS0354_005310 [Potamilus streckersoni]